LIYEFGGALLLENKFWCFLTGQDGYGRAKYIRYKSTVYFFLFENAASAWNAMLANGLMLVVDAKKKNGFEMLVSKYCN
jgi:hypothetical protein